MKTFLVLALLFCPLSGRADNVAGPAPSEPGATIATKAHPDLLRLEQELSRKLDDKKDGRVTLEQYQAWKGEFRARLDAAITRVPPSPDNTAANARIMAQLGEGVAAHAALDQALEQNLKNPVLLTTKGQVLYDQKDFPGAAHNALQAWENSGRTDKGAWALYQMSKDRGAPSETTSASPGLAPLTQGSSVVSADDSNKPIKLAVKGSALPSLVPTPGQDGTEPIKREGGLPLWPLAVPLAGGLIGYGLYRGVKQNAAGQPNSDETPSTNGTELLAGSAVLLRAPNPESAAAIEALIQQSRKAAVAKEAAKNAAKEALKRGLPAVTATAAVTALTFGVIIAAGVATIYGLDEMIAAQDKYNEAIDTHKPPHVKLKSLAKKATIARENLNQSHPTDAEVANLENEETKPLDDRESERAEYLAYKKRCDEQFPEGLDLCDRLRWRLNRDRDCVRMREEWDKKWAQRGKTDHEGQLDIRRQAVTNTLTSLRRNKCPEIQ